MKKETRGQKFLRLRSITLHEEVRTGNQWEISSKAPYQTKGSVSSGRFESPLSCPAPSSVQRTKSYPRPIATFAEGGRKDSSKNVLVVKPSDGMQLQRSCLKLEEDIDPKSENSRLLPFSVDFQSDFGTVRRPRDKGSKRRLQPRRCSQLEGSEKSSKRSSQLFNDKNVARVQNSFTAFSCHIQVAPSGLVVDTWTKLLGTRLRT